MIVTTAIKNKTLRDLATLIAKHKAELIAHNQQDLQLAGDLDPPLLID